MERLKQIQSSNLPANFVRQWNEMARRVEMLEKITVAAPLAIDKSGGIPKLTLANIGTGVLIGSADANITACSSGTVSILDNACADTSRNETAYNPFTSTVTSGNRVILAHGTGEWSGRLVIIAEDCT